jgi:hypothetical protein
MHPLSTIAGVALAAIAAWAAVAPATAATWDESVRGDLSGDGLAPSSLTLAAGSNAVIGSFGASGVPDVTDLDYIAVTVPDGFRLDALVLTQLVPGGANSFLGIQAGPRFTVPPSSTDPSALLGWAHIYRNQIGTDLLPALGLSAQPAGAYTLWINETDTSDRWHFGFDLQLSAVPEPPVLLLAALGAAALTLRRRSKVTG